MTIVISSDAFIQQWKSKSYLELMEEREGLLCSIHQFEADQLTGNQKNSSGNVRPCPETRYRLMLGALSRLCIFMEDKYHREYADGRKALKEDAEPALRA